MKKKIILSSILALGVLGGVVGLAHGPVGVEAADVTGGTTLYLKPNSNWTQANARFAMYLCNGSSSAHWYSMYDNDGDGIYEATVDAGESHKNVIFCRMNPSTSTNDWNNRWNQSGDLTWDGSKNLCTINSGQWDCGTNVTWSTYVPTTPKINFMGTMTDWASGVEMSENNGVYTLSLENVSAGDYSFKVKQDDTWLGHSNITVNGLSVKNDSDDNCTFSSNEDGDYTFTYTLSSKTLDVSFTSYNPRYINELNTLITPYYNDGAYTRKTDINFNADALEDIATHFHGSVVLERTTYFTPEALWMTRGTEDSRLSYYGTSGENMTSGTAAAAYELPTTLGTVTKNHKDWDPNGKDENGMEGFYITLKDIMEKISTAKWTYSNGVYSSKELTDEFLAFTAPCLLDTQNYVQLAGVEIEGDTDGLHLRLLASETNSGALTVAGVLSEATITVE